MHYCKGISLGFIVILFGTFSVSVSGNNEDESPDVDISSESAESAVIWDDLKDLVAKASTTLSVDLMSQVTGDLNSGNLVVSPLGVFASLCLAVRTFDRLDWSDVMDYPGLADADPEAVMQTIQRQYQTLQSTDSNLFNMTLLSAWLCGDGSCTDTSIRDMQQFFDSEAFQQLNLTAEGLNAVSDWIYYQTGLTIGDIFGVGDVPSDTYFVLAAAYFQVEWEDLFNLVKTLDMEFTDLQNVISRVNMVQGTGNFSLKAADGLNASVLEMPFGSDDVFSLFIILPDDIQGLSPLLDALADSVDGDSWEILNGMLDDMPDPTPQLIQVPRFNARLELSLKASFDNLDLSKVLENVDLSWLDDQELPLDNFKNIAVLSMDGYDLDLEWVDGSDLGSVSEVVTFLADHPFLFVVRDNTNKMLLFLGAVAFPSEY